MSFDVGIGGGILIAPRARFRDERRSGAGALGVGRYAVDHDGRAHLLGQLDCTDADDFGRTDGTVDGDDDAAALFISSMASRAARSPRLSLPFLVAADPRMMLRPSHVPARLVNSSREVDTISDAGRGSFTIFAGR
jgi:hypothetical protein